jgi:hypothetical protein
MSITASTGKIVATFHFQSMHGAKAIGAYHLRFSLRYTMPGWPETQFRFSNIQARVTVGGQPNLLGRAFAENAIVLTSRGDHQDGGFLMDLMVSPRQMEEIEKIRCGGDLNFNLDLFGEIYDGYGYSYAGENVDAHVNQKSWIDLLKQLDFSTNVLLEIPHEGAPVEEYPVWKALEEAKKNLYYGNYDQVVASCRKALEGIPHNREEVSRVKNIPVGDRKKMTKRERLVYLLDALEHYTHPAHHLESSEDSESYTRSDAILAFGATISAISTRM